MKNKITYVQQPDDGTQIYVFDVTERVKKSVVVQARNKREAIKMAKEAFKGEDVVIKQVESDNTFQF